MKRNAKRLSLDVETVRNLQELELRAIVGGPGGDPVPSLVCATYEESACKCDHPLLWPWHQPVPIDWGTSPCAP